MRMRGLGACIIVGTRYFCAAAAKKRCAFSRVDRACVQSARCAGWQPGQTLLLGDACRALHGEPLGHSPAARDSNAWRRARWSAWAWTRTRRSRARSRSQSRVGRKRARSASAAAGASASMDVDAPAKKRVHSSKSRCAVAILMYNFCNIVTYMYLPLRASATPVAVCAGAARRMCTMAPSVDACGPAAATVITSSGKYKSRGLSAQPLRRAEQPGSLCSGGGAARRAGRCRAGAR